MVKIADRNSSSAKTKQQKKRKNPLTNKKNGSNQVMNE